MCHFGFALISAGCGGSVASEGTGPGTHSVARPSVPAFLRADAGFAFPGLFVMVGVTGGGKRR